MSHEIFTVARCCHFKLNSFNLPFKSLKYVTAIICIIWQIIAAFYWNRVTLSEIVKPKHSLVLGLYYSIKYIITFNFPPCVEKQLLPNPKN